eukprot:8478886-Pyramimonas_sp.AAC.1
MEVAAPPVAIDPLDSTPTTTRARCCGTWSASSATRTATRPRPTSFVAGSHAGTPRAPTPLR